MRAMRRLQGAWWEILSGTLLRRDRDARLLPVLPTTKQVGVVLLGDGDQSLGGVIAPRVGDGLKPLRARGARRGREHGLGVGGFLQEAIGAHHVNRGPQDPGEPQRDGQRLRDRLRAVHADDNRLDRATTLHRWARR